MEAGDPNSTVKCAAGRILRIRKDHPELGRLPSPSPSANLAGQSGSNHESLRLCLSQKSNSPAFRSPAVGRELKTLRLHERSWRAAFMLINLLLWVLGIVVVLLFIPWLLGIRYIPHNRVGIVEKLWSHRGSLTGGRIVALDGEAGFQAELLRGGVHLGFFPWQYRIHKEPLVM